MNVIQEQDKHIYTYKIKKGISKVQGALQILEEMDYPKEIIQEVKQFHKKEVKKVQDTNPKDLIYYQ